MTPRKILWVAGGKMEALWGAKIAAILKQERGFDTVFLTNMKDTHAALKEEGENCVYLAEAALPFRENYDAGEVAAIEERYNFPGFNLLRFADETIKTLPVADADSIISAYYLAVEKLFADNAFSALVMFPTTVLQGRVPYSVARQRKVKIMVPFWGPVHNNTFVMCGATEEWFWPELNEKPSPDFDEKLIEPVVAEMRSKLAAAKQPSDAAVLRHVVRIGRNLLKWAGYRLAGGPGYNFDAAAMWREVVRGWWNLERSLNAPFAGYDKFRADVDYVFMPLHCHFDSTLTVASPMYTGQIELAKNVARSLPAGMTLYVKEHPYDAGYLTIRDISALRALGNVKVLHPSIRSLHIISGAKGVVTISSSAGWEAFLFRIPVFVFGNSFYSACRLVHRLSDFRTMRQVLSDALKKGQEVYSENAAEYKAFICHVIRSARKGNPQGYKSAFGWYVDAQKNAADIAEGLLEKLSS